MIVQRRHDTQTAFRLIRLYYNNMYITSPPVCGGVPVLATGGLMALRAMAVEKALELTYCLRTVSVDS